MFYWPVILEAAGDSIILKETNYLEKHLDFIEVYLFAHAVLNGLENIYTFDR